MKNKKNSKYLVLFLVSIFLLYIVFAFAPSSAELHLVPEWTEDISYVQDAIPGENLIPFKLAQNLGYFTENGKITMNLTFPFKATISEKWFATFGAASDGIEYFFFDGVNAGKIEYAGFPFFDCDRIFVFLPGGTSFIKCDDDGKKLWGYEGYSPITAFSSSEGGTVAGFADGTLIAFNREGKIEQKFAPGGSEIEVVLGVGISQDGKRVVAVAGVNEQRLVVVEKMDGHSKVIFHEYLPKSLLRQTFIKFSLDDNTAYYNYDGGLGIVNLETSQCSHLEMDGMVSQIEFSQKNEFVFVLSRDSTKNTVTIIESFDNPVAKFSFEGQSALIQVRGNRLFVGRDNKISSLLIEKK